ncbi:MULTISPECIES: hypothetical protein [Methylomonas]|uniref:Uncharacterized protein n=2 Tax=Methylomonas TaxID=416 RepID=A0A140E676_9GAMM|nr:MULTISPECIES: hypothetical protein [Methylomonas]AMK78900.1 hypothetical protein JT25_020835 [Methylomonas denitrificans]OAI02171.1 hypothetical protein A1342_02765 [Methylomonas methanica]TCV78236.1 hypothetical protein EDE11_12410 [Methylomonas methanica]
MTTEANQAEIRTENTNLLKHRLDLAELGEDISITDTLLKMAERLNGILFMLSFHFDSTERASEKIIGGAINAAIAECADIEATVKAHHYAKRKGGTQ